MSPECLKDLPNDFPDAARRLPAERLGGQLTEQPPIIRGELSGMAEAPALGDLIHGRFAFSRPVRSSLQLLTDLIEPNHFEIGHRAQSPDLLERIVQRPLAHA